MYRHSPIRNPRSKGIKLKNVLQGFLLVAICFWLIFQVKRSHDKKKEFDVHDNKNSLSTRGNDEIVKLGRKDIIQPKIQGTTNENEIHEDDDEHDENEHDEHEDNKHEEEDQEEEEKDDGGGGGDDEIDEKSDVEIDREEVDIIDEDKETEEHEEKDGQSQSQSQNENEGSIVKHDEDGNAVHTNEAREENYKADDASSAVTHIGRNLGTENTTFSSNVTMTQEKDYESIVTSLNATSSIDNGPPSGTTMTMSSEVQNVTVSEEQDSNSSIDASTGKQLDSYAPLTDDTEEKSSKIEDETNEGENIETNNVTEEILDTDDVERDSIDSTDPSHLEEKEVRNDLGTLPEIETEGSNSEDTAAE